MALSGLEIFYTIICFFIFILVSSINGWLSYLLTKYKIKHNNVIILLICMSQLLSTIAVVIKILSFTVSVLMYQLIVTANNWIMFSGLLFSLITIVTIYKEDFKILKNKTRSMDNQNLK